MALPPGTLTHNSIKIYEAKTQRYANLLFNRTDKLLNFIFNTRWSQPGYITVMFVSLQNTHDRGCCYDQILGPIH